MPVTVVREARTEADIAAVQRLRYAVYTAEMNLYREAADTERERLADEHDEGALQLLGEVDGQPVGTVRVHVGPFPDGWAEDLGLGVFAGEVPVERMAFGSRFTVLPAHRGTPVVLELVKGCFEAALRAGCDLLILDCVPHLMNLYESLGWRRYTRRTLRDAHTGVLVPMALVLRDRAHLERVRSPFVALLDRLEPGASAPAWVDRYFHPAGYTVTGGTAAWSELFGLLSNGERPLFAGLSEEEVGHLLQKSQVLDLEPGHVFVRQGTVYRTLFVVMAGGVEVVEGDTPLRTLGRGEVLGEVAWLLGTERTADVRAASSGARVLALHEGTLTSVMRRRPELGLVLMSNLARTLAARLASAHVLRPTSGMGL